MPRTFAATIGLIVVLVLLSVLTVVNIAQTNSAERTALDVEKKVDALVASTEEIKRKLEDGVAVSGAVAQGSAIASSDPYADSFSDPENVLKVATDMKVPPNAKMGGTLRRVLTSNVKGLNWMTENSVDVSNLQALVHSSWARTNFNNPDEWVSDLAHKITINDDFTEYTIYMRKGVYWQIPALIDLNDPKFAWLKKPRELTSDDAKFYFDLIKNPQVEAGALKNYYEDLDRVEIVDKYTFKVFWKKKTYQSKNATLGVYPLPKWLFTKDETGKDLPKETLGLKFNNHWASKLGLGVGPYRIVANKNGERITLARNDRYFGRKFPIGRIEYTIVKDAEAAYLKLKADEVDYIAKLPEARYKSDILEGKSSPFQTGKLEHQVIDVFAYYYMGWNADSPFFKDKKVRKAMTYALNRSGIVKNVLNGLGTVQTGPFYYKHPGTVQSIKPIPFDLKKASQLLDEAGWKDTDGNGIRDKIVDGEKVDFKFSFLSYDKPVARSFLAVYKEDLRKIGINMTPQPVDWPTMQKKMDEKNFDAFTGGWGLSWDVDPYQIWHSSQADVPKGSNRVGFRNKRADEIIETLRQTFDDEKRLELMHEFHKLLHEEQPYTFFYSPQSVVAYQPRMQNVIINKTRPQHYSLPWYIDNDKTKAD